MAKMGLHSDPHEMDGYKPIAEGRYHAMITDVNDQREPRPGKDANSAPKCSDMLTLEILAGECPGMEGKTLRCFLSLKKEKGEWVETEIHTRWAWAAGILDQDKEIDFYPSMLTGREVIVEVVNDGKYVNVGGYGYNVWRVGDDCVRGGPTAAAPQPVTAAGNAEEVFI